MKVASVLPAGSGSFRFCEACGFATEDTLNNCARCRKEIARRAQVAFLESSEAEQNTQISSAEESRERTYFQRREHLLSVPPETTTFPYRLRTSNCDA